MTKSVSSSHTTRRKFIAGTTSVVALSGLAGCGGDGGDGGGGGTGSGSTGDGSASAASSISIAAEEASGQLFRRLAKEYIEEDAGVEVNVEIFPYANLFEKVNSVLSTEGDAYDIIFMDDPWFPQFAMQVDPIKQWLAEDLPEDQLIDSVKNISTWPTPDAPSIPSAEGIDQKVRGQVIVGNTQLYAYNQAHYDQVGASEPETWGDVYDTGQKISEQVDGTNGYIIRGKRGNPIMANYFALGNSIGGELFTKDWRYNWDTQAGREGIRFYVEDLKSISPDGVTSFDSDAVLNGLADGSVAQAPAWPTAASLLLSDDASQSDNIQFTPIPKGHKGAKRQAPTQGNWIMGINSFTSNAKKKAAGKVISSAISAEGQQKYVELGGVPFRHDTFENNTDAQPWFPALYESLKTAQWRPRTPLWSEIQVTHGRLLNTALTGDISPKECTQQAKQEMEGLFENAGYYE